MQTVTRKQRQRRPAPPFITSTLQQEAARKLGFGTSRTMRVARVLSNPDGADLEDQIRSGDDILNRISRIVSTTYAGLPGDVTPGA